MTVSSPRAVSKQMDQLENELKIKLFVRQRNNTELTEQEELYCCRTGYR